MLFLSFSATGEEQRVAYVSEQGGISNVILYDTATSETEILTSFQDAGEIYSISATGDGHTILFTRPSPDNGRTSSSIWSINTDGSGFTDLYEYLMGSEADIDLKYAAVSPDGTKIVYSRNSLLYPGIYHLFIKTPSETRQLTSGNDFELEHAYPVFISDTEILFLLKDLNHTRHDYYAMNTDGTGITNLTQNNPEASPYFPRLGRPCHSGSLTQNFIIYAKQENNAGILTDWKICRLNVDSRQEEILFDNLYYPGINPPDQPDPQPVFMEGGDIALAGTQNSVDFNIFFTNIFSQTPYREQATFSSKNYLPFFFAVEPMAEQWLWETGEQVKTRNENGAENTIDEGSSPVFNRAGNHCAYRNNGIRMRRLGTASSLTVEPDTAAGYPAFSPDGRWIAYVKGNDIWARLVDMTNSPRQLTNSPLIEKEDISFSPCGRFIIYSGNDNGKRHIYRLPVSITYGAASLINPTGLPANLTPDTEENYQPSFSPDGKTVAFISTRNQVRELWKMNANGTGQGKVVFHSSAPVNPAYPQFSPYDNNIIAYLSGTPMMIYTVDISAQSRSGNALFPAITTTGRFSWAKAPSGSIEIRRHVVLDTFYTDIPLEYRLNVSINRKQLPAGFIVEEKVPSAWVLVDVSINGNPPAGTDITVDGDRQTIKWLFGGGGIDVADSEIDLTFDISGDTLGSSRRLTGGITLSGIKYITTGDSLITLGEPFIPVDTDRDWQIGDGELLDAIDMWAGNLQVNGWPVDTEEWDFWLLGIINFWANGENGYTYLTGGIEPMWELN